MYIYKLTQEYVKVRKLGQDFKDFIWRGLRIHPHERRKTGEKKRKIYKLFVMNGLYPPRGRRLKLQTGKKENIAL